MMFTIKQLKIAESNGIGYETLKSRKRRGWDAERMITEPPRPLDGWEDYKKLCRENDISYITFYSRVNEYGMDPLHAATEPVKRKQSDRARKFPKEYVNLAESNGISKFTFYSRVKKGMSLDEAATLKIHTRKKKNA